MRSIFAIGALALASLCLALPAAAVTPADALDYDLVVHELAAVDLMPAADFDADLAGWRSS